MADANQPLDIPAGRPVKPVNSLPEGCTREEHELLSHHAFAAMVQTMDTMRLSDLDDAVDPNITRALDLATVPDSLASMSDNWRETAHVRELYREFSRQYVTALKAAGFVLKAPKSQKVDEMLELVMTVPARKAYTL